MPLTAETALRKDRNTAGGAELQHRHFAFIAATIADASFHHLNKVEQRKVADMFAHACARTNPRFDRARFLKACGVE